MAQRNGPMELLAPAGSKESFVAALRAGADAVYLGVGNYNARQNADRLNLYDLEVMTGYAHERGRRIYVAFNTLIKQEELQDVHRTLARVNAIRPDALIVQDAAVAKIAAECFPDLKLHASTQMAAHNSYGVAALAAMGFERAILARELSFAELKLIAARAPVELEIFCHGALCFCVSGMCLFSSVLGSLSGNRGRCTQPCRRIWKKGGEQGYLFSPKDLQLAEHVPALKELGIASLKIEGRMRSSEYVHNVVRAYRLLIDAKKEEFPQALDEAQKILSTDWAREKSLCLFKGTDPALFAPKCAQCLGTRIGEVVAMENGSVTIEVSEPLQRGDRLRIADPASDRTKSLTVNTFTGEGSRYTLPLAEETFSAGTAVYKAGDASWDAKSVEKEVDAMFRAHAKEHPHTGPVQLPRTKGLRLWKPPRGSASAGEQLWVRITDPGWLAPVTRRLPQARIILSLSRENLHHFGKALSAVPVEQLAGELTPYIGQRELAEYQTTLNSFINDGLRRWVLNNVGHFTFFKDAEVEAVAGPFLYTWNTAAAQAWHERGCRSFIVSWEDDFPNVANLCRAGLADSLVVFLFGYPTIVRSRMLPKEMIDGGTVTGKTDVEFRVVQESGSGLLVPARPMILFSEKDRLAAQGVRQFGIDLSFIAPDAAFLNTVASAWEKRQRLSEEFKFNFRRGVR